MTFEYRHGALRMPAQALQRHSVRLGWALLASLLLHLIIIGDLAGLQWWAPLAADTPRFPLDVEFLPASAARGHGLRPASEPTRLKPRTPSISQAEPETEMVAAEPVRETSAATNQAEAAEAQKPPATVEAVASQSELEPSHDNSAQPLPRNGKLTYGFYWGKSRWLAGQAIHQWLVEDGYYTLTSTVRTTGLFQLLHPIKLVEISKGKISGGSLRPLQFSTQLNEYPPAVSIFDWEAGSYRWFRGKTSFTQVLSKNSYDKIAYLYQLYLNPRTENYYSAEITLGRGLEHYDILNLGEEDIEIEGRTHRSIHLRRATASPAMEQIDIWLATSMNRLPLKMTYANQAGDQFEQLLAADSLPIQ